MRTTRVASSEIVIPPTSTWLALVVLLFAAPTARTGELRIPLARLIDESELVVVARVTSVKGFSITRTATAEVEQVWKGPPTETLTFRAGALPLSGDVSWAVPDERVVLFLRGASDDGRWSLTEFGFGRRPIERLWGEELVSLTPDAGALMTSRVVLDGEHSHRWDAPFDLFEEQVRARLDTLAALREELLDMRAAHQRAHDREHALTLPEEEQEELRIEAALTDARHVARLLEIVAEFGWPGPTKVGDDGARAALVLVQQADHAPEFQASMLPRLEWAVTSSGVPLVDVADLTDRVRVNQGLPQVYGTRYVVDTDANGEVRYVLPLVEDVEQLDARRAEAGLRPWAEVERELAAAQGREPAARPRVVEPASVADTAERDG